MKRLFARLRVHVAQRQVGASFATKVALAMLVTASVAGCAGYVEAYRQSRAHLDPEKSMLVLYVRFRGETGAGWLHLHSLSGGPMQTLTDVGSTPEDGDDCTLFVGAVDSGAYEIEDLYGRNVAYKFPENSVARARVNVGKKNAFFGGEYELRLEDKGGAFTDGTFSFSKTSGCPSEKRAYQALLKDPNWGPALEETQWPQKLKKKIASIR